MDNSDQNSQKHWQQILKTTNLKAMSGTLRQIERIIHNDKTTVKQLADIILKDATLTPHVLTVANSATHLASSASSDKGVLTQAIVRIGFTGLRAICIAVTLMDSFLKRSRYRTELESCISQSFEVAVHARNVARLTDADEEDVFIAGLLQNLGEMVFWCSTVPESKIYKELLSHTADTPEQVFKRLSGMDFYDMSKELAMEWKLGTLLLESYGVAITTNTRAVHLGKRINLAIKQGWDSPAIKELLDNQLKELGLDEIKGMSFLRSAALEANALAASYNPHVTEPPVAPLKKLDRKPKNALDVVAKNNNTG